MNWLSRLSEEPQVISLGSGSVAFLDWNYAPHLPDNVPHRHTFFEVCQVGAYGQGIFLVEGVPHRLEPHALFIARPGVLHQIVNTSLPRMELFWVSFSWSPGPAPAHEVDRVLSTFAASACLVAPDTGGRLATLWGALRTVAQGDRYLGSHQQLVGLTTSLVVAIAQAGSDSLPTSAPKPELGDAEAARLRLALRYVHDNLDRRIPVAELAAQLNLSPRQLARLFARHLNLSPAAYIEGARLERAQSLLQNSAIPIKGVAASTGYETVHHFSRAFARRFGFPPGAFRSAHLRSVPNSRHVPKSQKNGG